MQRLILMFLIFSVVSLTGCQKYEETIDEAFEKQATNEPTQKLVTVRPEENLAFVLYLTTPDKEEFPNIKEDVISVDTFIKDEEKGWFKAQGGGWTLYENENMTIYRERYIHPNPNGPEKVTPIFYGKINNPKIKRVEVSKDGERFVPVDIFYKDERSNKRYYYISATSEEYYVFRGLSKDGEIIDQQGSPAN